MTGSATTGSTVDVLIVGAGPTGLSLAGQLIAHGITPRIVDRGHDRVHESRALAIQPRTLEVLADLGVTPELVANGNQGIRLVMHIGDRTLALPLFDLGLEDTAYPYLLFLSQSETERVLEQHLEAAGTSVERGTELIDASSTADGITATLRDRHGATERVTASYVVGCDGAHSTVRKLAQIAFEGAAYAQTFILADAEADGLEPGSAHAFLAGTGMVFFFPLRTPASWRLLAMRPPTDRRPTDTEVTLDEVQAVADTYTGGRVRLHDAVWATNFRLHHRGAAHYRAGRFLLAGDAAHIHSPVGAQGMNTGIQDATNIGWKLAHTILGRTGPELLDTYERERAPVGRAVLSFTDRGFRIATSTSPIVRFARTLLAPAVMPLALKAKSVRGYAFRTMSQLAIRYRDSPLSTDGPGAPRGPRAGDRLPDASVVHNGQTTTLHTAMSAGGWRLLLCGPTDTWTGERDGLSMYRLSARERPGCLHDRDGQALRRLGLAPDRQAQYLIRPDGHIGYRSGGTDLTGLTRYLQRWLP